MNKEWELWLLQKSAPSLEDKARVWEYWQSKRGWVYAAQVGDNPNLWKVGMTGKTNPFERVFRLTNEVASTEKFDLRFAHPFLNRFQAEKEIHAFLTKNGFHKEKEFFVCDLNDVKNAANVHETKESQFWSGWDRDAFLTDVDFGGWLPTAFNWDEWWANNEHHGDGFFD